MQPEAKFKGALTDAFKIAYPDSSGWFARVSGVGKDGVPDLVFHARVLGFARTLWVEAKCGSNRCSPAQILQLRRLARVGVSACVLRCPEMGLPPAQRLAYLYHPEPAANEGATRLDTFSWQHFSTPTFWNRLFTL